MNISLRPELNWEDRWFYPDILFLNLFCFYSLDATHAIFRIFLYKLMRQPFQKHFQVPHKAGLP